MREDDDLQIHPRRGKRLRRDLRAAAPVEHGVDIEVDERRQDEEEEELQGYQFADQLLAADEVVLAELDGEDRSVSRADEDAERPEKHHHGERERQSRHRRLAAALSDVESVDDGVERVEAHRHQRGPRVLQKKSPEFPLRQFLQILCALRHIHRCNATAGW